MKKKKIEKKSPGFFFAPIVPVVKIESILFTETQVFVNFYGASTKIRPRIGFINDSIIFARAVMFSIVPDVHNMFSIVPSIIACVFSSRVSVSDPKHDPWNYPPISFEIFYQLSHRLDLVYARVRKRQHGSRM